MTVKRLVVVAAVAAPLLRITGVAQRPAIQTPPPRAEDTCRELALYNGKIATMDARGTVVSSLVIRGDRIAAIASATGIPAHSPCAKVIDLGGRRVVPGFIDTHDHPSYFTARPGYDVRLDTARSVADIQAMIRKRAESVPQGQWVTSLGGWSLAHIAEHRMPTIAELDAAAPAHPVLLALATEGAANRAAKTWFSAHGVSVGDSGALSAQAVIAALGALRATQTMADRERTIRDLLAYYASLGVTTHIDNGGGWPPNPAIAALAQTGDGGLQYVDPINGYVPEVNLSRKDRLPGRLRLLMYSRDLTPELPFLKARLDNQMMGFGSDWVKVAGVGERVAGGELDQNRRPTPQYEAAVRLIAQRGWSYQQHANPFDEKAYVDLWEKINATIPLAPLHWTLAHVTGIDRPTLDRLRAMGVGVSITGSRYMSDGRQPGPPIRTIVESGVHASYGSDNPTLPPTNPWLHMYAIVTGRNFTGVLVDPDQTLSREAALRLYTASGAWFTDEEDQLGSLEVGKLADVVVLSDDFLDPIRVSDEAIKQLKSVLTIVGGRIVHDTGVVGRRAQ